MPRLPHHSPPDTPRPGENVRRAQIDALYGATCEVYIGQLCGEPASELVWRAPRLMAMCARHANAAKPVKCADCQVNEAVWARRGSTEPFDYRVGPYGLCPTCVFLPEPKDRRERADRRVSAEFSLRR